MMMTSFVTLLAMAGGAPAAGGQANPSPFGMLPMIVIMFGIFYFMLIRPQQRKEKERKKLIADLKSGERILFAGGLIGTVTNIKDTTFIVKVAENVKIEIARGAVTRVLDADEKVNGDLQP